MSTKTQYLIRKEQEDGSVGLVAATREEWNSIKEENKNLPKESRRYFILDCIQENDDLDLMYIEVPLQEYRVWRKNAKANERNRKAASKYDFLSMDAEIQEADVTSLHECIADPSASVEATAITNTLVSELRSKLRQWKPWAEEMLDLYLAGNRRSCTKSLAQKHDVSEQIIRERKREFEQFSRNFIKGFRSGGKMSR